jgi:hypothetical protein
MESECVREAINRQSSAQHSSSGTGWSQRPEPQPVPSTAKPTQDRSQPDRFWRARCTRVVVVADPAREMVVWTREIQIPSPTPHRARFRGGNAPDKLPRLNPRMHNYESLRNRSGAEQ